MIKSDKCPLCLSKNIKYIYTKKWKSSNFSKCNKCGIIFQNPQEHKKDTAKRYESEYFEYEKSNQENFFNLINHTLNDFEIPKRIPKNSKVLEIGSATGLFLRHMDSLGYKSTGIDLCKDSVEYGKKNFDVDLRHGTLEDFNFEPKSFDFIHFSHLIEHLNDPFSFLNTIYSLTKEGGHVLLTTPNSSGIFSNYFNENWRCIVDDHLFLFNKSNLKKMSKNSGFKIIKTLTWGSIPGGHTKRFLKTFTDKAVKATGTGDVVALLLQK